MNYRDIMNYNFFSKELSIIIVNWNSAEYLRKCIKAILNNSENISLEIIVVDNASYDGCEAIISHEFNAVKFIQSERNLGFAGANNLGFERSLSKNLLFLNPDTEIRSGALIKMLDTMESDNANGIVGAHLLNTDGSVQSTAIQKFPTILNQLLGTDILMTLYPNSRIWNNICLYKKSALPVEVDVVSGACLMIRREVFEKVNMFSTDYFMYSEDIDLCYKVRKAGWKVVYLQDAIVIHHGGKSSSHSNSSSFSDIMILESRLMFFRKFKNWLYCIIYRILIFFASGIRILFGLSMLPTCKKKEKSAYENMIIKWMKRMKWSIGGEKWVRRFGCYE